VRQLRLPYPGSWAAGLRRHTPPSSFPPPPTPAPKPARPLFGLQAPSQSRARAVRAEAPRPSRRGMTASLRSSLVPWRWGSEGASGGKKSRPLSTRPLSACFQQAAVLWPLKAGWNFRDSGVALTSGGGYVFFFLPLMIFGGFDPPAVAWAVWSGRCYS
jgi:hypothetical protein